MKNKKEKIELPKMEDWLVIDKYDLIDLYKSVMNKIKEILGDVPLYILWKNYDNEYKVFETNIDNIKFMSEDYGNLKLEFKKGYCYNIENIYKNKEDAYKQCESLNVTFIEEQIQHIQKKIDNINPVKLMEDAEKQRSELFEKYKELKNKLEEIKGKSDV